MDRLTQWRRSQVKSRGGVNIEKIEGVGSGEGLCPRSWGPRKKEVILRKKVCNSEQVLVLLSYITAESGGLSPVLKVGDLSPAPPARTPMSLLLQQ